MAVGKSWQHKPVSFLTSLDSHPIFMEKHKMASGAEVQSNRSQPSDWQNFHQACMNTAKLTEAWARLCEGLPALGLPAPVEIEPTTMPTLARQLLDHDQHMTEVMSRRYGGQVVVDVQRRQRHSDDYWRQIVLRIAGSPAVIQGGLVRVHLHGLSPAVVTALLEERVALGYLLKDHQVLRRIELRHLVQFAPSAKLQAWLGGCAEAPAFGRLATLFCDGQPVIELAEILPPGVGSEP